MQTVLDAMKITLYENLKRSVVRYAQMERKQWVMFKEGGADPQMWRCLPSLIDSALQ